MTTFRRGETTSIAQWLALATQPGVVRRAIGYAVVVGAVLIFINHGDAILRGDLPVARLVRMGLTVLVPYAVSTLSSVGAMRAAACERAVSDSLHASAESETCTCE